MYVHMLIYIVWKLKRCTIFRVMGIEDERSILAFSLQSTWVTGQHRNSVWLDMLKSIQGPLSFQQFAQVHKKKNQKIQSAVADV